MLPPIVGPSSSTLVEPRLIYKPNSSSQYPFNTKKVQSALDDSTIALHYHPVDALECSVHTLPKPLLREFLHVFGDKYTMAPPISRARMAVSPAMRSHQQNLENSSDERSQEHEVLAIATNQRAREDLVAVGDEVELEKDRLLNVFMEFGDDVCKKLREQGYWADYIDPCSGLPMLTPNCNKVYSEVDGMEVLLGYRSHNAGFCKILLHPLWGSAVYPATIFIRAPFSVLQKILEGYPIASNA